MSGLILLDFLSIMNSELVPCFFLLGFAIEKKISWLSIFTISLLFDWIIYPTKCLFLILCTILKLVHFLLSKYKWPPFLKLCLYYLIFFGVLGLGRNAPLSNILNIRVATTFVISSLFLLCYIKKHSHS